VKIIDLVTARLDARTDSYVATLPSLRLRDARIEAELVKKPERMLTGGFYAEVTVAYDPVIAQEMSGRPFGVAALLSLCSALLRKSIRGGLIIVGELTIGGSIEPVHNAVTLAEIAVEKGAQAVLLPVSCRRDLVDLSDDMATKIDVQFYKDARDALLKAMVE
jgi:predicted ATP-dependent Lon-type protease